jgi:hypothetical protein
MSGDHNMFASGSGDGQRSGWRKRTIMEMAREAGFELDCVSLEWHKRIEAFAKLVRANEREAIAKLLENTDLSGLKNNPSAQKFIAELLCAYVDAIRARGQA